MFVVLDTNHYGELAGDTTLGRILSQRLLEARADAFTTIITIQEVSQGWLAEINRRKAGTAQLGAYQQFSKAIAGFSHLTILPFDREAALVFHQLHSLKLKVGTMDLKIAAICISHEATLLSRNLIDFDKVPGLKVTNWLQ